MTTEQENKIIEQAQDIIERRMAAQHEFKINMRNVVQYGAYYQGALMAICKVADLIFNDKPKNEDWIYLKAEFDLIIQSKRNVQLWLDGQEIRFRNHNRDKKGKLVSCEAYFSYCKTVIEELK